MAAVHVCQICSGDIWAGKENVCAVLTRGLVKMDDIEVTGIVFNEGRLARELRDTGTRVDVIDESQLGMRGMSRRLKEIFAETKPDVVHAHGYKEHILGAFAARSVRARVVRTFHGMPEPKPFWASLRGWGYRQLQRFVTRRMTDIVVVVSKDMERRFEAKTGRAKLVQIYNGIEVDRLPKEFNRPGLLRELGLPDDSRLVGAVGRLVPVKGLNYLLDAAAILAPEHPEMYFLIAGDGPLRGELERQARELGIADRVHFLGHRDDATRIIGCLNVLAMPSLHEGIPMTLLEARALGVSVAASGVGGVAEALSGYAGARSFPRGNAALLGGALESLGPVPVEARSRSGRPPGHGFAAEAMIVEYSDRCFRNTAGGRSAPSADGPGDR